MKIRIKDNFTAAAAEAIASRSSKAENIIAVQVQKDTEPFVPMLTGSLNARTKVAGNTIIYPGPYARYLYYGKVMVDSATGKGPMRWIDKTGNEYIRFHKGAVLRPTDRPLNYTTDFHKDAGPAWIERSKAQNLEKWIRIGEKVVNSGR